MITCFALKVHHLNINHSIKYNIWLSNNFRRQHQWKSSTCPQERDTLALYTDQCGKTKCCHADISSVHPLSGVIGSHGSQLDLWDFNIHQHPNWVVQPGSLGEKNPKCRIAGREGWEAQKKMRKRETGTRTHTHTWLWSKSKHIFLSCNCGENRAKNKDHHQDKETLFPVSLLLPHTSLVKMWCSTCLQLSPRSLTGDQELIISGQAAQHHTPRQPQKCPAFPSL